jgi:hypothetical protein
MLNNEQQGSRTVLVNICLGLYLAGLFMVLISGLVVLWPLQPSGHAMWPAADVPLEARYLLIVAISGALGTYIHLTTSFTDHTGARRLSGSWTWWYLLRPYVGASLALLVYFTVRGGLIQGADERATANLSPYGLSAVAGMSGLFSRHATDKLREVFENLFRTDRRPEDNNPDSPRGPAEPGSAGGSSAPQAPEPASGA